MHLPVLLAFTAALAVAVAIPGPGIFAVVSCALGRGFREALALITGIVVLTVGLIPAAYAVVASASRRFLARPSRLKFMNRTAGTMMIGTGLAVARP